MKLKLSLVTKIFMIFTLVLIVAGMAILGFLDFNQPVDNKNSYEISITASNVLADDATKMKNAADDYFNANNKKNNAAYATQVVGDGETLIYKFHNDPSNLVDGVTQAVTAAVPAVAGDVEVNVYQTINRNNSQLLAILLTAGITAVALLIYLLILEKPSSGLAIFVSVFASSLISVLVYVSAVAASRLPASPFITTFAFVTAAISAVFSFVIATRCNQLLKFQENKGDRFEIASKITSASILRVGIVAGAFVVAAVLIAAIAPTYFKFAGAHLAVAALSATLSTLLFGGLFWALIKGKTKTKKVKPENEQAE